MNAPLCHIHALSCTSGPFFLLLMSFGALNLIVQYVCTLLSEILLLKHLMKGICVLPIQADDT